MGIPLFEHAKYCHILFDLITHQVIYFVLWFLLTVGYLTRVFCQELSMVTKPVFILNAIYRTFCLMFHSSLVSGIIFKRYPGLRMYTISVHL